MGVGSRRPWGRRGEWVGGGLSVVIGAQRSARRILASLLEEATPTADKLPSKPTRQPDNQNHKTTSPKAAPSILFQLLPNSLMASMKRACSSSVHFSRALVMV